MSVKRKLDTATAAGSTISITKFFKPVSNVKVDVKKAHSAPTTSTNSSVSSTACSTSSHVNGFDKQKWIESLSPSQRELLDLEITTLHESWLAVLYRELTKPYFLSLKQFLKAEKEKKKTVFPPAKDIYSWSNLTPLNKVKVIILGQDPYHNVNQAHGLAFSVNPPTPPPPSLKNIYKCLKICYPDYVIPKTGLLTPWAEQGVLLLNASLTVEAHKAFSHANKGWEQFTEKVLSEALKNSENGICILAWGRPAAERVKKISPSKKDTVLYSVHPSPLSASRGFFECAHFTKANDWLYEKYGSSGVINWALVPSNRIAAIEELQLRDVVSDNDSADEAEKDKNSERDSETENHDIGEKTKDVVDVKV